MYLHVRMYIVGCACLLSIFCLFSVCLCSSSVSFVLMKSSSSAFDVHVSYNLCTYYDIMSVKYVEMWITAKSRSTKIRVKNNLQYVNIAYILYMRICTCACVYV